MSDQGSTTIRPPLAPAPVKFVRKHSKAEAQQTANSNSKEVTDSAEHVAETNDGIWGGPDYPYKESTESKYYTAHRQHVAEQLKTSYFPSITHDDSDPENDLWDGLLRILSL
jgi:hypothetical protein